MGPISIQDSTVAVSGSADSFPVRRIFCIGRNYAAHTREMGGDETRDAPFYFSKAADTVVANGSIVNYPPRTEDLHHEIELVVAVGAHAANISVASASDIIFGYAVGIDLTRRDLQKASKEAGRPWDTAKNFDQSAPTSEIVTVESIGHPAAGRIWLAVNERVMQDGDLADMIWSVPEALAEISTYCALAPGDLVFTGTPAGVGSLVSGDKMTGGIDGVGEIEITIE